MKKSILKFAGITALAIGSVVMVGCSDEETTNGTEIVGVTGDIDKDIANGLLFGNLKKAVTLDASKEYSVVGNFKVLKDAKLTIPAGTKIVANDGGADVYIAVMKGGMIDIQGTQEKPVLMTSKSGNAGSWGGLTICGDATTTAEVDATAEVGGFLYGGNNDADNSGSIKNLIIKGSGAQINTESQYNGLSLYAVGSATVIENVAIIDGKDDGVEFFGGTVSAKNLYLENNEDDSIDWTEGWNGTVENAYISHTKEGFSTALEGDKVNNNPKFINLTAISTVKGKALQFKKESGGTFTNLYLEGYATNIDMKDNGALENVVIEGKTATLDGEYKGEKLDISKWSWYKN